jgi:epoxyqueuosine reductase
MAELKATSLKKALIEKAHALGFELAEFTTADPHEDHKFFSEWVDENKHGTMDYLKHHLSQRKDPNSILEEARSVLCLGLFYNPLPDEKQYHSLLHAKAVDPLTKRRKMKAFFTNPSKAKAVKNEYIIASYACSRDYHKVIRKKLRRLEDFAQEELGIKRARGIVDSAPFLERSYAKRAGLGWVGKNTMLIHPKKGSYFFLAELLLSHPLDLNSEKNQTPSQKIPDQCGSCTRCLDACPTEALTPYEMDARKCISYWTIEHKGELPKDAQLEDHIFGCDICQIVCPYNHEPVISNEKDFKKRPELSHPKREKIDSLKPDTFFEVFKGTPVMRTKWEGLRRSLNKIKETLKE